MQDAVLDCLAENLLPDPSVVRIKRQNSKKTEIFFIPSLKIYREHALPAYRRGVFLCV